MPPDLPARDKRPRCPRCGRIVRETVAGTFPCDSCDDLAGRPPNVFAYRETPRAPGEFNADDDALDGVLFRFWIRAAAYPGGWPGELERVIRDCLTPADYRRALVDLAQRKGVNLPLSGE